ncbi:MAG: hypothetical protein AB1638_05090 [Nitrospirota bacterium]
MSTYKTKKLISILMESPLYLKLSTRERHSLLTRLANSYPFLFDDKEETTLEGQLNVNPSDKSDR